ncbi:hypothetical protein C2S53_007342 [Perilla frutescens var. hirtella]|uniref:Uncharacterized protein n=1 Tax=Perilla frutescens var. hirtella TaxID=608512 RepID=A0AAD4JPC7_PERFH|nr:hypothetical protein C2S53_007342 [Perilla frutescens var. hirtella]
MIESMFSIIHRRRPKVLKKGCIFAVAELLATKYGVFPKSFSSRKSSACGGDPDRSFTVSYLINSCGLPEKNAVAASKKLCIESRENPDAVLELLTHYGFTNAHISNLVSKWPFVLQSRVNETLMPKLEFFRSIGVPDAVSAQKLSTYPGIMKRSLENCLIPVYNDLKSVVQSDEIVVRLFARAPRAFASGWRREHFSNIAILRERGVPESCILPFLVNQPSLLILGKEKFTACLDRAAEMGFDVSKSRFLDAVKVFACMSERTLKHKRDVYGRCGWSESEVDAAFVRSPNCMTLSENKIRANMDFLVSEVGLEAAAVARRPLLLSLNLDRMRARWSVAKVLMTKGLLKESTRVATVMEISEEKFLKRYISDRLDDIPQLIDVYRGKLSLSEMECK